MICVLLASGFEEIEALAFTDILRRAGLDAVLVSTQDTINVCGSHKIEVVADCKIDDIDYKKIEAVVLPGGLPGAYNLHNSNKVKAMLDYAVDNNDVIIGAICASPYIVLEQLGYLNNVKSTVNPAFYDDVKNSVLIKQRVVADKNIITSQGPGTTHEFAKAFIEIFKSRQIAEELISEMLYK